MAEYIYHAVDSNGLSIDGTMTVESEQQLDARMEELGYWLIDVSEKNEKTKYGDERVPRKELIDFFNGLHSMLAAGIPISTAISAIADETEHEDFSKVLRDLRMNVEAGVSLDEAMSKHRRAFNTQIINLIKAGDFSGNLTTTCADISHHLEWVDKIMADIKQASIYPVLILTAVMGLVFLMFSFVVPRFNRIFVSLDMELPALTQAVVDIGSFTTEYWWLLLSLPVFAYIIIKHAPEWSPAFGMAFDNFKLNIPVFGSLNRMIVQSRFCHNLGLLLKAGVPILEALTLCKALVGNRVMEKATSEAAQAVNEGRRMTEALRKHGIISPVVLRMMVVGEETGQLDMALEHASQRFDTEVPRQIKRVFSILEPMIMITLIIIVGLVGGAVFLPMFSLMSGIGG